MINIRNISIIILIAIFTNCNNNVESANILGLFTTQSKSHLVIHFAAVRALVERGHNVTVVTTLHYNETNLNGFRHIVLPPKSGFEDVIKQMILSGGGFSIIQYITSAIKTLIDVSSNITLTDEFQKIMKEDKYDLILLGYIFNEFHLGLSAHFDCPVAVIWVQKPFHVLDRLVGNPLMALDYSRFGQMAIGGLIGDGFFYRIVNFLWASVEVIIVKIYDYIQKSYYEFLFPPEKYPSYETMLQNVSLLLINHHFSEGYIRANVPNFVEIGGIQVKPKPDPLPDDIKNILDKSSEHGAILFSLGSNVKVDHIPINKTTDIYEVLSNLKQNVIWKWDSKKYPGNSSNILFKDWLPQDDILAHPNLKLFITHGGKGSLVEASYHGIPTIGIPLFADQPANINEMTKKGFGIGLDFGNLTVDSFKSAINEVLSNDNYKKEVQYFSELYRDRPMTAKESVIYWIEYVIRHKGAKHMISPAVSMNEIQLLGLDVIGFLLAIIYIVYRMTKFIFKSIWSKCCARKEKQKVSKGKVKSKKH